MAALKASRAQGSNIKAAKATATAMGASTNCKPPPSGKTSKNNKVSTPTRLSARIRKNTSEGKK